MVSTADFDPSSMDFGDDFEPPRPRKKVPHGDIYEAARAGDLDRLKFLLNEGIDINVRDKWDSVPLYYTCLAGHVDAAKLLLEAGAICSEHTFDGDRCHYAALNLRIRKVLKSYEMRPPPMDSLPSALKKLFNSSSFYPDFTFYVRDEPITCHRSILSSRSPYFKKAFSTKWKERADAVFFRNDLSLNALQAFLSFLYCDRIEIDVDEMENLAKICKVCKCLSLLDAVNRELESQKYHHYKAAKPLLEELDAQKRWVFRGSSLPVDDRLEAAMEKLFWDATSSLALEAIACSNGFGETHSDVVFAVGERRIPCHKSILAVRSDYFKALFERSEEFSEGGCSVESVLEVPVMDLSEETFLKVLEYIYTDKIQGLNPENCAEMFEASSRFLLFPLKRAVADTVLPFLQSLKAAQICEWLLLSDFYGVWKLREFCLDAIAANFEVFAKTAEFRELLRRLPPPSGDSSDRTTAPSAPGGENAAGVDQSNVLDDLREKWLEVEGDPLQERDASALQFDQRLILLAQSNEVDSLIIETCDRIRDM